MKPTEWESIANYVSDRSLVFRIYEKHKKVKYKYAKMITNGKWNDWKHAQSILPECHLEKK